MRIEIYDDNNKKLSTKKEIYAYVKEHFYDKEMTRDMIDFLTRDGVDAEYVLPEKMDLYTYVDKVCESKHIQWHIGVKVDFTPPYDYKLAGKYDVIDAQEYWDALDGRTDPWDYSEESENAGRFFDDENKYLANLEKFFKETTNNISHFTEFMMKPENKEIKEYILGTMKRKENYISWLYPQKHTAFAINWLDKEHEKYKILKDDTIERDGKTLYRIQALRDFGDVKAGDLGGYIESEDNLSHCGNCWIYKEPDECEPNIVYGNAHVYDDAKVDGQLNSKSEYVASCIYGERKKFKKFSESTTKILGNSTVIASNISAESYIEKYTVDGEVTEMSNDRYIYINNSDIECAEIYSGVVENSRIKGGEYYGDISDSIIKTNGKLEVPDRCIIENSNISIDKDSIFANYTRIKNAVIKCEKIILEEDAKIIDPVAPITDNIKIKEGMTFTGSLEDLLETVSLDSEENEQSVSKNKDMDEVGTIE